MNDDGSACFARLLCVVTWQGVDAFFYVQSALTVDSSVALCVCLCVCVCACV